MFAPAGLRNILVPASDRGNAMRHITILAASAALLCLAGAAKAQIRTTADEENRCVAEEKHRDQLALRRLGQRTRDEQAIRDQCKAEVARRFDDRVLGRAPQPGPPPVGFPSFGALFGPSSPALPVGNTSTGAPGTTLVIQGSWHHVGVEIGGDNRYAYFIESTTAERGAVGAAWLTSVYERGYPDGAASTAYRVRVNCASGRWAYQYEGIRDAGFRVLRANAPDGAWRAPVANPNAPIARVRSFVCANADPGVALPADAPAPGEWARRWFAANPR
jgi:hypothetical protein